MSGRMKIVSFFLIVVVSFILVSSLFFPITAANPLDADDLEEIHTKALKKCKVAPLSGAQAEKAKSQAKNISDAGSERTKQLNLTHDDDKDGKLSWKELLVHMKAHVKKANNTKKPTQQQLEDWRCLYFAIADEDDDKKISNEEHVKYYEALIRTTMEWGIRRASRRLKKRDTERVLQDQVTEKDSKVKIRRKRWDDCFYTALQCLFARTGPYWEKPPPKRRNKRDTNPEKMIDSPKNVYCVGVNCTKNDAALEEWNNSRCSLEDHFDMKHKFCGCPLPFRLHGFPSRIPKIAGQWAEILRYDVRKIGPNTRICTEHFFQILRAWGPKLLRDTEEETIDAVREIIELQTPKYYRKKRLISISNPQKIEALTSIPKTPKISSKTQNSTRKSSNTCHKTPQSLSKTKIAVVLRPHISKTEPRKKDKMNGDRVSKVIVPKTEPLFSESELEDESVNLASLADIGKQTRSRQQARSPARRKTARIIKEEIIDETIQEDASKPISITSDIPCHILERGKFAQERKQNDIGTETIPESSQKRIAVNSVLNTTVNESDKKKTDKNKKEDELDQKIIDEVGQICGPEVNDIYLTTIKDFIAGKPLECSICGLSMVAQHNGVPGAQRSLARHYKAIHSGKTIKCDACGRMMTSVVKEKHSCRNKLNKLTVKGKEYILDRIGINEDQACAPAAARTQEQLGRAYFLSFRCAICGKQMRCRKTSIQHSLTCRPREDEIRFPCPNPECEDWFENFNDCRGHYVGTHYPKPQGECPICHRIFFSKETRYWHILYEHDREQYDELSTFSCEICDKKFPTMRQVRRCVTNHKNTKKYNETESEFTCDICGCVFPTFLKGSLHRRKAHAEKVKCEICDKEFHPDHLKVHKKQMHGASGKPSMTCKHCDLEFHSEGALHTHLKKAHNEGSEYWLSAKTRTCDVCGKVFKGKSAGTVLSTHKRFYHEKIGHSCQFCGKLFATPFTLRQHEPVCDLNPESSRAKKKELRRKRMSYPLGSAEKRPASSADAETSVASLEESLTSNSRVKVE